MHPEPVKRSTLAIYETLTEPLWIYSNKYIINVVLFYRVYN